MARRKRGLPVIFILATLAAIPLAGVVFLSTREVLTAMEDRANVEEVELLAQDAVLMSELRTAFVSERNWFLVVRGLEEIGLPPEFVTDLTEVDIVQQLLDARETTDGLLARLQTLDSLSPSTVEEMVSSIQAIRNSDEDTTQLLADYRQPELVVDTAVDGIFTALLQVSHDLPDGSELIRTVEVLLAADRARIELAVLQASAYATLFDLGQDLQAQYLVLLSSDAGYRRAIDRIRLDSAPGSKATAALVELDQDPDVQFHRADIAAKVESILANGYASSSFTLSMLSDLIGEFEASFEASINSVERHSIVLHAAGEDLAVVASQMEAASNARLLEANLIGALFLLASGLAIFGGVRTLVRPLNELAQSAADLSSGATQSDGSRRGPSEVRSAARAIQSADTNLALAREQALALASGKLDDPSLSTTVKGSLGASLRAAVKTLAETIKRNEEFSQRLRYEASHDSLTGIANRAASLEAIKAALQSQEASGLPVAVMFIDLDGFKAVNDRLGHHTGDLVLQEVSGRLLEALRPGDRVGRLGGDEFVIVASPVADVDEAIQIAERLIGVVCREMTIGDRTVKVGASIGVALGSVEDKPRPEQLLSDADLAVYRAKGLGTGQVELCDDQLREDVALETSLTEALRKGLDHGEFCVHYQAVVNPSDNRLKSLEALVRWDRPGHGLLEASRFVEFASRSDLIVEIDRQVLAIVSRQLTDWSSHPVLADIPISVNVSGRNLASDDFATNIVGKIESGELDPARFRLEVKENSLFANLDLHAPRLQLLRDFGVKVAVDNFGTGYTSLAQLRHLPVDILKIDSSFVSAVTRGQADRDLVKMIMATGQILGATILAEGVETQEQADQMQALGSDEMQGYLFSASLPADELLEALGISA